MNIRTRWKTQIADIVLGGLILVIALWFFLDAQSLATGPGLFPRFILGLLTLTGAGILAVAILSGLRGRADPPAPIAWARGIGVPALILIAAGAALYALGFYVASPLLIIAIYLWHCHVSNGAIRLGRDPGVAVALAVGATLVMYLVFDRLIGLPVPTGALL